MNRETRKALYRYKPFFMPIGGIIAVVCVVMFFILPFIEHTRTLYDQIASAEEQLNGLKQKLAVLNAQDQQKLENQVTAAISAISIERGLPGILRTVENVANESNLLITSVSFSGTNSLASDSAKTSSEDERQFGSYRIPFTITTTSDFDAVRTFLEKTVQVRRFIRANSFNLNFGSDAALRTYITFDAFYLPLQPGNPSRPIVGLTREEEQLLNKIQGFANAGDLVFIENDVNETGNDGLLRNPFQ